MNTLYEIRRYCINGKQFNIFQCMKHGHNT